VEAFKMNCFLCGSNFLKPGSRSSLSELLRASVLSTDSLIFIMVLLKASSRLVNLFAGLDVDSSSDSSSGFLCLDKDGNLSFGDISAAVNIDDFQAFASAEFRDVNSTGLTFPIVQR